MALAIDKLCNMDELADVEHRENFFYVSEPMRKSNQCKETGGTAPPRRFYRTFWRSFAGRLKTLDSIQCRHAEDMAYKIKVPTQVNVNQAHDQRDSTLDNAS
uniref:Uncharacterized protein n=1 Tax=Cryptomonas curvata TaxID=233186 RepID=A0A7S0MSB9_9CRYP